MITFVETSVISVFQGRCRSVQDVVEEPHAMQLSAPSGLCRNLILFLLQDIFSANKRNKPFNITNNAHYAHPKRQQNTWSQLTCN